MSTLYCRGVRGATTVDENDRDEILQATRQLLALLIRVNDIRKEDVASATFTVTRDLDQEFPALAARQLGWIDVPLLCSQVIAGPGTYQNGCATFEYGTGSVMVTCIIYSRNIQGNHLH